MARGSRGKHRAKAGEIRHFGAGACQRRQADRAVQARLRRKGRRP